MSKLTNTFINAVVNVEWKEADKAYDQFKSDPDAMIEAAQVFFILVKNHQNIVLRTALKFYGDLPLNVLNRKGQLLLGSAYHCANLQAIDLLLGHPGGNINPAQLDKYHHNIVEYAKWSKLNESIEHAKALLKSLNKAAIPGGGATVTKLHKA